MQFHIATPAYGPEPQEVYSMSAADLRIAIVVNPNLSLGFLANTVGAIGIGLGAAECALGDVDLTDKGGFCIKTSADRVVPILQADRQGMRALLNKASDRPGEANVVAFPAFARSVHSFAEYQEAFPTRSLLDEKVDGVGLCGPAKWVKSLTGSLKLLR